MTTGNSQKQPEIAWFEGEDPGMLEAIQQAQATFGEFKKQIEESSGKIFSGLQEALIKYAVPATKQGVKFEHLFVSNLRFKDGLLIGTIDSEPAYTDEFKAGSRLEIDESRVTDWLYRRKGKAHGGFTFRYMWQSFSEKDKALYRSQPPFVWLDLG